MKNVRNQKRKLYFVYRDKKNEGNHISKLKYSGSCWLNGWNQSSKVRTPCSPTNAHKYLVREFVSENGKVDEIKAFIKGIQNFETEADVNGEFKVNGSDGEPLSSKDVEELARRIYNHARK